MRLIAKNKNFFGLRKMLYDAVYLNDPAHEGYKLASHSNFSVPANLTQSVFQGAESTYQSTRLPNGVTVLTESVSVPSTVNLGVFADVGSRDEDAESSGALLLLKHVALKTALSTNETVNYGVFQMSGAKFEVKYNNENIYYRSNCLSHDVIDNFSVLVDCALEPRNAVACAVGRDKSEEAHLVDSQTGGNNRFNDQIYAAAFGGRNLGNPAGGRKSNISNLSAQVIQKFQLTNFTNDRLVISATGIENHQEFVDLVSDKLQYTQLGNTRPNREAATYVGGEIRNYTDASRTHVALAFQGATYKDAYTLLVAAEVLGHEGRSNYTRRNILDKNVFVNEVQPFSNSFSDSGLFGLKLAGSASHLNQIVQLGAQTLSGLRNLTEADVQAAKASLKARLAKRFADSSRRNEEMTKALYYLNENGEDYRAKIDAVTVSSLTEAVSKALKTPLTLVIEGGEVSTIGSYDKITNLFK